MLRAEKSLSLGGGGKGRWDRSTFVIFFFIFQFFFLPEPVLIDNRMNFLYIKFGLLMMKIGK